KYYAPVKVAQPEGLPLGHTAALNPAGNIFSQEPETFHNTVSLAAKNEALTEQDTYSAAAVQVITPSTREIAYPALVAEAAPTETPSSRSIAATLARLEQAEPDLIRAVL